MTNPTPTAPPKATSTAGYTVAAGVLLLLNGLTSFAEGAQKGMTGAELAGYSMGTALVALIVVAVVKLARRHTSSAKIATYTLLVTLITNSLAWGTSIATDRERPREFDPPGGQIAARDAESLANEVSAAVRERRLNDLATLRDVDRFRQHVFAAFGTPTKRERQVAEGAAKSFREGTLLSQIQQQMGSDDEFVFVKFYEKGSLPIIQFRASGPSIGLHYIDLYLGRSADGRIRIDDMQYYNSGDRISRQVVTFTREAPAQELEQHMPRVQEAMALSKNGDFAAAQRILESLPDRLKNARMIMRLRAQIASSAGDRADEDVVREFRRRYPTDSTVAFSAFSSAANADETLRAATLLAEIDSIVGGDEYLLWYRANLLGLSGRPAEAVAVLRELSGRYARDIREQADERLVPEVLRSSEFVQAFPK